MSRRIGKIIPNGISLEKHENNTVVFFTNLGYDIELIPPSHIEGVHTPDFIMLKEKWEMKSLRGGKESTLEHAFKSALKQSENIILDFRGIKNYSKSLVKKSQQLFTKSKRAKKMKIIDKTGKLLEFKK